MFIPTFPHFLFFIPHTHSFVLTKTFLPHSISNIKPFYLKSGQGKCTTCACAKKKTPCTDKCHGGQPNHLCLCWDGTVYDPNPKLMNPKQLRQFLAQHSLSPMGNKTELLLRTRDYLEAQKSTSSSSSSSSSTSTSSSSSTSSSGGDVKLSGKETMAKIIDLHDNYEAILSIAGTEITKDSGTSVMRRAYLKISMKVHPDKNGQSAESKNAFQLLVSAYERLSQPELYMEEDAKSTGPKQARLSRSNHGCTITRLDCPRCHMQWNKAELGLEKAAYNFMMQGKYKRDTWIKMKRERKKQIILLKKPTNTQTNTLSFLIFVYIYTLQKIINRY